MVRKLTIRFCVAALAGLAAVVSGTAFARNGLPEGAYRSGPYTLEFKAHGKFRVMKSNYALVEGDYKVAGDRIELTDRRGPFACKGAGQATGTYTWKLEEGSLMLSKIEDKCSDRSESFATSPWKRQ